MKIARTMIDGAPAFIGSEDGKTFYMLDSNERQSLVFDKNRPVNSPKLLAPVVPQQIFAIGLNYRKHAEEFNNPIPEYPVVFMKSIGSVIGPNEPIVIPPVAAASFVDYEVELAIVIGKLARNVKPEDAFDYVMGYTIANDVSSRDWQKGSKGGGQWCRAKSFDTFCPLGPWVVTTDELTDPNSLTLESRVNGELRQQSNTNDMIFPVQQLISFVSQDTTLLPGAVILTGTPSGVGAGMDPRQRLAEGDEVRLSIEGIGELINPVVMGKEA